MGKATKPSKNQRCYQEKWEKDKLFKGWIGKCPEKNLPSSKIEEDLAFCDWCKMPLRCHTNTLKRHAESVSHLRAASTRVTKTQKTLAAVGVSTVSNESKKLDIQLVLYAAIHGTINSIDHLGELLRQNGKQSKFENLQLHRTKASEVILNVIDPAFLEELIEDIGKQGYSIIIDESTDNQLNKFMAYCVRYFSEKHQKIVVDFLGFSQVITAKAVDLYNIFKEFLNKVGLELSQLIGIGTDGAANSCGKNSSLYTMLKKDVPNLQLVKCTCHSIEKCTENAFKELPSNISFMVRETNNVFSCSPIRIALYQQYYASRNGGRMPKRFLSLSLTRWLVIYSASLIVLDQFNTLKSFFNNVTNPESPNEYFMKCYTSKSLTQMFNDDSNRLYLIFMTDVLKDFYDLNLSFQKENADFSQLYTDLRVLLMSLANRVFNQSSLRPLSGNSLPRSSTILHQADLDAVRRAVIKANDDFGNSRLPLAQVDFGNKFTLAISNCTITHEQLIEVKRRCANFMITLCKEVEERLPQNVSIFEKMRHFSPLVFLSPTRITMADLPWDLASENINKQNIESQLRRLQTLTFDDISPGMNESVTTSEFWINVWKLRNVNGQRTYNDLAEFVLRALSLPISNGGVERIFSIMNAIKTKVRNRMLMLMLVALIRIRVHIRVLGICCKDFIASQKMLSRFNKNMYEKNSTSTAEQALEKSRKSNEQLLQVFELYTHLTKIADGTSSEDYLNDLMDNIGEELALE